MQTGLSTTTEVGLKPFISAVAYTYGLNEVRWLRFFEQNFRVVKWIVGRGYAAVRSGSGSK